MSVRIAGDSVLLEGPCPAEDAETLLIALQEDRARTVDLAKAGRLHTAVVQILLAAKANLVGVPGDPFQRDHVFAPLIQSSATRDDIFQDDRGL
jgi:hypothetical protein